MDRVFESGAAASPPSAPASPSSGYPSSSNPTVPGAHWFYQMTEELLGILTYAGITPDHTDVTQVLAALKAVWGNGRPGHTYSSNDWAPLPGGLILQWCVASFTGASSLLVTFPIAFPNAVLHVSGHGVMGSGSTSPGDVELIGWDSSGGSLTQAKVVSIDYNGSYTTGAARLIALGR